MGIKEALDAIDALKPREQFTYLEIARNYCCLQLTLSWKYCSISALR
jgi:hypothetical protein